MNMPTVTPNPAETLKVEPAENTVREGQSQADAMKNIRKARLQRQVLQDPTVLAKLVALETTPVYNAKGDIVQAVSGSSLQA
jgi:hypothetical protein